MVRDTISVSGRVKEKLQEIKERDEHTSMDSVLRYLLRKAESCASSEGR